MNKIFHVGSTFKAFEDGDDLLISGMASTKDADRVGDVIDVEAWTKGGLNNFLNNPVILFNHDYNKPIGRAVSVGTNDKGLELKAKIAKSAGQVGDLIREGVLGAFSVGFRVKDAEYMSETDGYRIKDAELLEVSVVTVPANQAATFSLAKSFNSEAEYKEFKESFKLDKTKDNLRSEIQETEEKSQQSDELSTPTDLLQVKVQEKSMTDMNIDAIVAAAVEKTAAAMAMKEAERKAEEKAMQEAQQKAAAEAEAQKSAEQARIVTAVQSGTEKLYADLEKRFAEKDADYNRIIGELKGDIEAKAKELEAMHQSKRVFSDRTDVKSVSEDDMVNAHILGVVTRKGMDTKFGRSVMEKAVAVPNSTTADFTSIVSTAIERDIELELILDPLFKKVQMNAASLVIPTFPDAGYAEWAENNATGGATDGDFPNGNMSMRTNNPGEGIAMGSKVLQTNRLISRSYLANEAEEDAIMPILPLIREAMIRSHARAIENSLLLGNSGESGANGGVNVYKGLVRLATDAGAVTNLAGSPGVGTVTATDLLALRQGMGKYGRKASDVIYIVSLDAYYQLLDDTEFQTVNQVGSDRAIQLIGEVANVFGSPVIVSDEFSAKADGNAAVVAVNARNFVIPQQRGITVESDYSVANQHRVLVATQRRGFDNMFSGTIGSQVRVATW